MTCAINFICAVKKQAPKDTFSCSPAEGVDIAWPSVQDFAHVEVGILATHAGADERNCKWRSLQARAPSLAAMMLFAPEVWAGSPLSVTLVYTFVTQAFESQHGTQDGC